MVPVTPAMIREIKVLRARKALSIPALGIAARISAGRLQNILGGHIRKLKDDEVARLEEALGAKIVHEDGVTAGLSEPIENPGDNHNGPKDSLDAGLHLDMNFHLSGAMLDRWDQESRVEALRAYRALCEFRAREVDIPPVVALRSELDRLSQRLMEAKTPEQRSTISREIQELARRQRA